MRLDERLNEGSGVNFDGELIDSRETPFQLIEVFATQELGKLLRIDGANMTSERDEFFYHENIVHPAAIAHPAPKNVLIIGGGDGGAAEEVLKHPSVQRVVIAELDAGVIEIARKHFQRIHRGAFDDARVEIRIGDGIKYLRECGERQDLIYLDLTDPVGPAEALYAADFYADCRRALNGGGALVAHIGSPFSHAARVKNSIATLQTVFAKVTAYFVHVPIYGAVWGFAIASDTLDAEALDANTVEARLRQRKIGDRQFYNGDMHEAMFARPEYLRRLLG